MAFPTEGKERRKTLSSKAEKKPGGEVVPVDAKMGLVSLPPLNYWEKCERTIHTETRKFCPGL